MCNNKTKDRLEVWSLYQFFSRFPDEQSARDHTERMRWPGERFCPHCGSIRTTPRKHKTMPYRCKDCRKEFSVRTGTIFQKAKLPVQKCLLAIYLLTTAKKGISSHQLAKELGCTQKTAWYLEHRIRKCMTQGGDLLSGEVEADETCIGGKERNKHEKKKLHAGRGGVGKKAVFGMKERGGEIRAYPAAATKQDTLQRAIKSEVKRGSMLYTDESRSYCGIDGYIHETVVHSVGEYVKEQSHTNGVESFWTLLKRGYKGTCHQMSHERLHRYIDEFAMHHNRREFGSEINLNMILSDAEGKHLPYKELIS